jgi:hypothetical protein
MPDETPDNETGEGDGVIVNNPERTTIDPNANTTGSDRPS